MSDNPTPDSSLSASLASLIIESRKLVKDSLRNRFESFKDMGTSDGAQLRYDLGRQNVVADGSLAIYDNGTKVDPSQYDETNLDKGFFTFVGAPTNNDKLNADFYWVQRSDADFVDFLNSAANDTVKDQLDPNLVPAGMKSIMLKFTAHYFFMSRATEEAEKISSSSGGTSVTPDNPSRMFSKMASDYWKAAVEERDAYRQGQGGNKAPAVAVADQGWRGYTPRR